MAVTDLTRYIFGRCLNSPLNLLISKQILNNFAATSNEFAVIMILAFIFFFTRSLKEKQLEFQHGAILALGHSFDRRLLLARLSEAQDKMASADIYMKITKTIFSSLDNSHNIISAACLFRAEVGLSPSRLEAEEKADADTMLGLVTKLLALVKSGKTSMKVRKKEALTAGSLCPGDK